VNAKKGPDNAGPLLGVDDDIRVFEPLAITGLQLVKFLSTHKYMQNLIHLRPSRNSGVSSPQVSPAH